jgi:hypothetical protein
MKKTIVGVAASLVLILVTAAPALAHLELGEYRGTTDQGAECAFVVQSVSFENGVRHPLNERVAIDLPDFHRAYVLSHLPVINRESGKVTSDKAHLTGAFAAANGQVYAASLTMIHRQDYSGPDTLLLISNEGFLNCSGFAHVIAERP